MKKCKMLNGEEYLISQNQKLKKMDYLIKHISKK